MGPFGYSRSDFYKTAGKNATVFNQKAIKYALLFIWKLLYKQEYLLVLSLCLLLECCIVQSRDMLPFTKISLSLLYIVEPQASDFAALSHKHGTDVYHWALDGWIQMGEAGTQKNGILLINISQHYRLQHISSDPICHNCLQVIGMSISAVLLATWET